MPFSLISEQQRRETKSKERESFEKPALAKSAGWRLHQTHIYFKHCYLVPFLLWFRQRYCTLLQSLESMLWKHLRQVASNTGPLRASSRQPLPLWFTKVSSGGPQFQWSYWFQMDLVRLMGDANSSGKQPFSCHGGAFLGLSPTPWTQAAYFPAAGGGWSLTCRSQTLHAGLPPSGPWWAAYNWRPCRGQQPQSSRCCSDHSSPRGIYLRIGRLYLDLWDEKKRLDSSASIIWKG